MEEVRDAAGVPAGPVGVTAPAGLRFAARADANDLVAFLGRLVQLDPSALVRLRTAGGGPVTAYSRLPFNVLVSRSARAAEAPRDVTLRAAELLAAVDAGSADLLVAMPARHDAAWRGQLSPTGGWQQLDRVPVEVVARLVRAGAATLKALGGQGNAALNESLLDHEALTVTGGGQTVVLPLRVLSAVWRMGFLGDVSPGRAAEGWVVVSTSGSWVRLAAPYGSAYHQTGHGLLVRPR